MRHFSLIRSLHDEYEIYGKDHEDYYEYHENTVDRFLTDIQGEGCACIILNTETFCDNNNVLITAINYENPFSK